jgi:2-keto-4-pentenoate hydratase
MDRTLAAAEIIVSARRSGTPLGALPPSLKPQTLSEGYRIQKAVHQLLAATDWGEVVGYKIGCTSAVMQRYLGIPHPCAGGIFAGRVHPSGVTLEHSRFVRVGVECEIAVRLRRDLSLSDAPFTQEHVADAVEAYMPAVEIVDERYSDWPHTEAATLIADDFFAAGCVLGEPLKRDLAPDLSVLTGRLLINDRETAQGKGSDVMGHPHLALAWLANSLAERGEALQTGQIVLTGSLVQTLWPASKDQVSVVISGLGSVRLSFRDSGAPG